MIVLTSQGKRECQTRKRSVTVNYCGHKVKVYHTEYELDGKWYKVPDGPPMTYQQQRAFLEECQSGKVSKHWYTHHHDPTNIVE